MSADEPQGTTATPTNITSTPIAPPASQAITDTSPSDFTEATIPLPPLTPHVRTEPEGEAFVRFDLVLVALTLLFAFGQGAHQAINSDLWMHLAAGRDILNGTYNPFSGTDPYSYSTTGARWVNHSWLYDLVVYGVHGLGGIPAVIAFHALLVAATAFVLVHVGRRGVGLALPSFAAALAILASSPRYFLQPTLVSYLFLALTLWFLQRGGRWNPRDENAETPTITWKNYWLLLPLFVAWVNLDEWFFLGPLTVALYTLGQGLQKVMQTSLPRTGEVRALLTILVAGLAACLVNPQHVFAFTLPVQLGLSPLANLLQEDSAIRPMFYTPFNRVYFVAENLHAAHLAFFVLAVLTLISFGILYRTVRLWRVLLCAVFFVLASWHARAIPFFAVIAGPVFALNAHEVFRLRKKPRSGHDPLPDLGRAFVFLTLLTLLVTGYPGWLHSRPHERRRFAFDDGLDPDLKATAQFLKQMHKEGVLKPDAKGYYFSPEIGNALAWFAPEVKGFFDSRYALHANTIRDFLEVRRGLYENPFNRDPRAKEADWKAVLERQGIGYLVLYSPQTDRLFTPLFWLTNEPVGKESKGWALLDLQGHTAVYGTRDHEAFRRREVNFKRLACDPPDSIIAPEGGMSRLPQKPSFLAPFTDPPLSRTPEADDAQMQVMQFRLRENQTRRENQLLWERELCKATLASSLPTGSLAPPCFLTPFLVGKAFRDADELLRSNPNEPIPVISQISGQLFGQFLQSLDDGPPENLLLAVRAARRGSHEKPNAKALAEMGIAYHQLRSRTRERVWAGQLPWIDPVKGQLRLMRSPLGQMRHVQIVSALEGALLYGSENDAIHDRLAEMYSSVGSYDNAGELHFGFKDMELSHLKARLRRLRQTGLRPGDPQNMIEGYTADVERLTKQVEGLTNRFDVAQKRMSKLFEKAHKALELNLAGKALDLLLDASPDEITPDCVQLQIELGLMLGRITDVQAWFDALPNARSMLSEPRVFPIDYTYLWLRTLHAAAKGDYASADHDLLELIEQSGKGEMYTGMVRINDVGIKTTPPIPRLTPEEGVALLIGKAVSHAILPESQIWPELARFNANLTGVEPPPWTGIPTPMRNFQLAMGCRQLLVRKLEMAHLHLIRALLALEQGNRPRAEDAITQAILLAEAFGGKEKRLGTPSSLTIAESLREWMKVK